MFGPCRQQREVDLVALQVPGLLVQVQRHPVAEPFQSEPRSHAVGAGGVASKADLLAVPVKKEALTRGQQGAQTRARRNADRPELVSVTDLGNNILSSSQLVAHLHGRPEWQDCKHKVRVVWQNQQRVASKVQCAEGAACPFVWHCTYFLTSLGHAAGTLLITSTGKHDHAKPEVGSGRPAKLWTPRQLGDACHYMASTEKGQRSARQLQEHMVAKKHAAGSLPTLEQMSTWMQNHSRKRRDPSSKQVTAAGQEVAPTQIALEDWPRCGKALEDLYLLGPQVVSAAEVFVPFTCRGMLSRLSHYSEEFVNLAVDAKMKVLDRGAGVATVSLLVKDGLRCTDVGAGAGRVPFTTRAVPFLQATMHQETTANYVRLFRVAAELWEACHPSRPPLRECVRQLHKDFAPSIETAWQEVFPNSRPCDDWFHFRQKRRELESRCKKLELKGGRYCKVNADWLMACLEDVRLAPTLPFFSEAWGGMLKRLEAMDEGTVQAWLRSQYTLPVPPMLRQATSSAATCRFASFWVGVCGIWPGSGSGNESAESLHLAWQRQLASLGGKGNVVTSLKTMQELYKKWASFFRWHEADELRALPDKTDADLLNGDLLQRGGRSTAYDLCRAHELEPVCVQEALACGGTLLAMPLSAERLPLDREAAGLGLAVLRAEPAKTQSAFLCAGVLQPSPPGGPTLRLGAYKRLFSQLAYVWVRPEGPLLCSCRFFALHAQCEHVLFARAQSWPCRPPDISFEELPRKRKAGARGAAGGAPKKGRVVKTLD